MFLRSIIFFTIFIKSVLAEPYYIWHWHMQHEFDKSSLEVLESIPIKGVFYRTGHFSFPNQKPHFSTLNKTTSFIESFRNLDSFDEIHLAYSFGNSALDPFVKEYLNKNKVKAVEWMGEVIKNDFSLYSSLNTRVLGIQIDLEGSQIDFDIYRQLLDKIKSLLPGVRLSITPMSSWVKRKEFKKVADAVDMVVPMLYDFKRSSLADHDLKVTDYHWLQEMVKLYDDLGKPVIYGLPTYSYSIVYDQKGKMEIPWALISPDAATENLRLSRGNMTYNLSKGKRETTRTRDRVLTFEVTEKLRLSNQTFAKGSKVKYNFLSPSAVAQFLEAVENTRSTWGRGVAFFRFGIPGEALVLDAWRLKDATTNSFGSKAKIKIDYIKSTGSEFFLAFTNLGRSTYFGKTGLKIVLPQGLEVVTSSNGDFERIFMKDGSFTLEEDYFQRREMLITPLLKLSKSLDEDGIVKLVLERSDGISIPMEFKINPSKKSRTI